MLLHNVLNCEDAENDADRTVAEIVADIDSFDGYISKAVLESSLYCCNMQLEKRKFWHPMKWDFDRFLRELLPKDKMYNKYYNVIVEKKKKEDKDGSVTETGR